MTKRYKVTAPCVTNVPASTASGPTLLTFYKDAILPQDVPEARLKHLLDGNLIEEVKGAEVAQVEQAEQNEQAESVVEPRPANRSAKR